MAIVNINFFSESLLRTTNFIAIVPVDKRSVDGNHVRGKEPFKTLYLLHGVFGSEYDWITGTRIKQWAQDRNLVVIMPAGENKFYCNQRDYHDNFETYVGEELVCFTRTMFRLSERRDDTYIAGLSMGGLGAIYTGLRYPETFGAVGAFSSALILDDFPNNNDSPVVIHKRSFYEAVLGKQETLSRGRNDYYALADLAVKSGKPIPDFFMACGTEDPMLSVNRKYRDYLLSKGIPVEYREEHGGHEWGFWDKMIYQFTEWLPLEEKTEGLSSGHIE